MQNLRQRLQLSSGCPTGKLGYQCRKTANEVAERRAIRGVRGNVYQCPYCKGFHLSLHSEATHRNKERAYKRRHFIQEESCGY